MQGRILVVFGICLTAGLLCASASPIAGPEEHVIDRPRSRTRRQTTGEDVRDCSTKPTPYEPDTVNPTLAKVTALRDTFPTYGINAYIVPSEDAHDSEYVATRDQRRANISGLTGSAGLAIITMDATKLWTDGRYFLQAEKEMECQWDLMKLGASYGTLTPSEYLADTLNNGSVVGFDPTLMTVSDYKKYKKAFKDELPKKTITLKSIKENLIDLIWENQPNYNENTVITILDAEKYTGETWQQKVITGAPGQNSTRQEMVNVEDETIDALVITKLDEIAWLFNLRGKDIPFNPMFVSYAIVTKTDTSLYLYDSNSTERVPENVRTHLNVKQDGVTCRNKQDCVFVKDYTKFLEDLQGLNDTLSGKIWISNAASYAVYESISEEKRYIAASPLLLMKAVKSDKEAQGMEDAHLMDSVAICNLIAWIEETVNNLKDPMKGDLSVISELSVMQKAEEYRAEFDDNRGLSFGTIAGMGPHGAIIHYESSPETDVPITKAGTFLLDSGGQYLQGTCDITRTLHFGTPTAFMKEAYTRVLLGSIDLAMSVFRTGIYGRDIDALARNRLWSGGLDYNHGTGHGIGHFLNVHEGPARIGSGGKPKEAALEIDMFLSIGPARIKFGMRDGEQPLEINMFQSDARVSYQSNIVQSIEPGYYEDGSFGIRIENVVRTVPATVEHKFEDYDYMTFKMISLVPHEPNLIDFNMFNSEQLKYYNDFNQNVRDKISNRPGLSAKAKAWMMRKTEPVVFTFELGKASGQKNVPSLVVILAVTGLGVLRSIL